MEKLRLEGTLSHQYSQGITMADTELWAGHFVVETTGNIILAELRWQMLLNIAKIPFEFQVTGLARIFQSPEHMEPYYLQHNSTTGNTQLSPHDIGTEVKVEGGHSQQHKLKGKAVFCTGISRG